MKTPSVGAVYGRCNAPPENQALPMDRQSSQNKANRMRLQRAELNLG